MEALNTLEPVIILLVVGILAIAIMRPIKMSPIVGYILAGILIGANGFKLVEESSTTHLLAELGVVFLLFDIGLHFSLKHIWDARKDILGFGPIQVILSTIVFALIAIASNFPTDIAIIIGATLALSSTAVAIQIITDSKQSHCPAAMSATAILIFQDICAIFLFILAASVGNPDISLGSVIGIAAIKAIAAFITAIFIGRYLITPLFRLIAKTRDNEIFTATALFIVLATAAATEAIHLSLTLGAFLAGMVISETPYRHVIQTEVKPFRGLLLGFFFITVGMALNTEILLSQWWKIILIAIAIIVVKILLIMLAARLLKTPTRDSIQIGVLISQGSEFAFVIFAMLSEQGSLADHQSALLISAVVVSMALTPPLVGLQRKLANKWANQEWFLSKKRLKNSANSLAKQEYPPEKGVDIIIVGMGTIGLRIANALDAHGMSYRGVENNHQRFLTARTNGYSVGFGDATDLRMMDTIKMSRTKIIIITFINYAVASQLAPIVLQRHPGLRLMVSVDTEEQKIQFDALGMVAIIEASFPKGLDTAAAVLYERDIEEQKIQQWLQRQQDKELGKFSSPHILVDSNKTL
jgi:CPA2 family monovalent cation:H+ antiporter-2